MHDSYYIIPAVHVQKISKSFDIFCANKGFEMYHNMQGAAKCPSAGYYAGPGVLQSRSKKMAAGQFAFTIGG